MQDQSVVYCKIIYLLEYLTEDHIAMHKILFKLEIALFLSFSGVAIYNILLIT